MSRRTLTSAVRVPDQPSESAAAIVVSSLAVAARLPLMTLNYSFPLYLLAIALFPWHPAYSYAWDFHAFYRAGAAYFHLHTPYVAASLANLTSQDNFVYPLPIAALFAPVSLIPYSIAAVLFIAASVLLLGAALRLLGVRDWRCYAAVYLSLPVQAGVKLGTISPLLVFLLALLWRYRDRVSVAAPVLALLVLSKLFLWPVALWFLFTKRYRVFVIAVLSSVGTSALAAIPFGIDVVTHYPHLLRSVSAFESPRSFSLYALAIALGLSTTGAIAVSAIGGACALYGAFRWSRTDQARAFRAVVLAALLLSPLVWDHYLVLLAVPLAMTRPRFSPIWLALAWVFFDGFVLGHTAFVLVTLAVLAFSVVQADLVALPARLRLMGPMRRIGFSHAMLLLWVPCLVGVSSAAATVPAVAALRSPTGTSPTGTAFLRLAATGTHLCWRVWISFAPPDAQVSLVRESDHVVLARHAFTQGEPPHETCTDLPQVNGRSLVAHFRNASGGYDLVVKSPAGQTLLGGVVVRRVDAASPIAQSKVRE